MKRMMTVALLLVTTLAVADDWRQVPGIKVPVFVSTYVARENVQWGEIVTAQFRLPASKTEPQKIFTITYDCTGRRAAYDEMSFTDDIVEPFPVGRPGSNGDFMFQAACDKTNGKTPIHRENWISVKGDKYQSQIEMNSLVKDGDVRIYWRKNRASDNPTVSYNGQKLDAPIPKDSLVGRARTYVALKQLDCKNRWSSQHALQMFDADGKLLSNVYRSTEAKLESSTSPSDFDVVCTK